MEKISYVGFSVHHFDLRVHVWSRKKSVWSDLASLEPQFVLMEKLLQLLAGTTGFNPLPFPTPKKKTSYLGQNLGVVL